MSNNPTDKAGKPGKTPPVSRRPKLVEMPQRPLRKIDPVWIEEPSVGQVGNLRAGCQPAQKADGAG